MVKIDDIRSQTPKGSNIRTNREITKVARHHSATEGGDFWSFWNSRWKNLGWAVGGYHEIILRDGTVQLCYDSNIVTNGVRGHNEKTYHICVVGRGSFTTLQEQVFEERAKLALRKFQLTENDVLGHQEFSGASTMCPGIEMDAVRSRLKIVEEELEVKVAVLTEAQERMRRRLVRAGLISEEYEIKEHELALFSVIDLQQQRIEKLEQSN